MYKHFKYNLLKTVLSYLGTFLKIVSGSEKSKKHTLPKRNRIGAMERGNFNNFFQKCSCTWKRFSLSCFRYDAFRQKVVSICMKMSWRKICLQYPRAIWYCSSKIMPGRILHVRLLTHYSSLTAFQIARSYPHRTFVG